MYRVLEATVAYATLICTFYYYYYYYYYYYRWYIQSMSAYSVLVQRFVVVLIYFIFLYENTFFI